MSKFIKIPTLNFVNVEADTNVHLRADEIIDIREATSHDRKQRTEVGCLVILRNGTCLASSMKAQAVVEEIEQVVF